MNTDFLVLAMKLTDKAWEFQVQSRGQSISTASQGTGVKNEKKMEGQRRPWPFSREDQRFWSTVNAEVKTSVLNKPIQLREWKLQCGWWRSRDEKAASGLLSCLSSCRDAPWGGWAVVCSLCVGVISSTGDCKKKSQMLEWLTLMCGFWLWRTHSFFLFASAHTVLLSYSCIALTRSG